MDCTCLVHPRPGPFAVLLPAEHPAEYSILELQNLHAEYSPTETSQPRVSLLQGGFSQPLGVAQEKDTLLS